jgi:hypothetical protein
LRPLSARELKAPQPPEERNQLVALIALENEQIDLQVVVSEGINGKIPGE